MNTKHKTLLVCAISCKSWQAFGDGGISLDRRGRGWGGHPLCFPPPLFAERGKELVWVQNLPAFFTLAAAEAAANEDADDNEASQHRHGDD